MIDPEILPVVIGQVFHHSSNRLVYKGPVGDRLHITDEDGNVFTVDDEDLDGEAMPTPAWFLQEYLDGSLTIPSSSKHEDHRFRRLEQLDLIAATLRDPPCLKRFVWAKQARAAGLRQNEEREGRNRSSDPRSIQLLEQRIAEWVSKLGVELLFVEEVQRLVGGRKDAAQVTNQFQTMLDRGVVPLVLMGTEEADELFAANKELRPRLGTPLQLLPVPGRDDEEAEMLQDFCEGFDRQLQEKGIFSLQSNLDQPEIVQPVSEITGGHVGRVARLFKEATVGAVERGAEFLEPFDLSNATRHYAIANGWIDRDPFSNPC